MIPLRYEGDVFRPPSEAKSLILQATIGCSHNRCTFCGMYKRKKFRIRNIEEIKAEIDLTSRMLPHTRRIFLADGNALAMSTNQLVQVLKMLNSSFSKLERISLYGKPHDLLEKSTEELKELRGNNMGIVYLGIESGSASVLKSVKKGVTPQQIAEGAVKARTAGVPLSITVLNGLAGTEGSAEHASESARLLNEIDPEYLGLLSLITVPGTTMYRQMKEGLINPLGPWELLKEIRMIIEGLSLSGCIFRANHASNYLPLKAVLSRDKDVLLSDLDRIIHQKAPGSLKSEYLRGL